MIWSMHHLSPELSPWEGGMCHPVWGASSVPSSAPASLGWYISPAAPGSFRLAGRRERREVLQAQGNPSAVTPSLSPSQFFSSSMRCPLLTTVAFQVGKMGLRKLQSAIYTLCLTSSLMLGYYINALAPDKRLLMGKSKPQMFSGISALINSVPYSSAWLQIWYRNGLFGCTTYQCHIQVILSLARPSGTSFGARRLVGTLHTWMWYFLTWSLRCFRSHFSHLTQT